MRRTIGDVEQVATIHAVLGQVRIPERQFRCWRWGPLLPAVLRERFLCPADRIVIGNAFTVDVYEACCRGTTIHPNQDAWEPHRAQRGSIRPRYFHRKSVPHRQDRGPGAGALPRLVTTHHTGCHDQENDPYPKGLNTMASHKPDSNTNFSFLTEAVFIQSDAALTDPVGLPRLSLVTL